MQETAKRHKAWLSLFNELQLCLAWGLGYFHLSLFLLFVELLCKSLLSSVSLSESQCIDSEKQCKFVLFKPSINSIWAWVSLLAIFCFKCDWSLNGRLAMVVLCHQIARWTCGKENNVSYYIFCPFSSAVYLLSRYPYEPKCTTPCSVLVKVFGSHDTI